MPEVAAPLIPRWYQQEAIDATIKFLTTEKGNGTLDMPTASGKAMTQAEIAKAVYNIVPTHQMVFLTDVTNLIGQNRDETLGQWPKAKTSIFSASYKEKSHKGELVFCGIQSVYKMAHLFKNVSVLFIDEIHRASLKAGSMYWRFFHELKKINPHIRIIGFSASPWKMTGSIAGTWICDKIIYKIPMRVLLDEGFLNPLVTPPMDIQADLSGVRISSSGEFNEEEMAKIMDDDYLVKMAIKESIDKAVGRHSILVFASSVRHANHIKEALRSHGEHSEIIIGDTVTDDRTETIRKFNNFELRWLISVGTLTTGFNSRVADCGVFLRATKSSSLWIQLLGRLMRIHESKIDGLVLCFGGNVARFGPVDQIGPPPTKDEVKQAKKTPFKQCGNCSKLVKYLEKVCPWCKEEFGSDIAPNHGTEASTDDIMGSSESTIKNVPIDHVTFCKHHSQKSGGKSLRITYHNGLETIHYYLKNDSAYQRSIFCKWWGAFAAEGVNEVCPKNLDTALVELKAHGMGKIPTMLKVDYAGTKKTSGGNIFGHKILDFS